MTRPHPQQSIRQPGPPNPSRITSIPAATLPIDTVLPAGPRLLDALAGLMVDGIESACLTLHGGALGPFAYVIPALSPDGSQAAFYSATFSPPGTTTLDTAAVTLGWKDGAPFFHCHAIWTQADGQPGCGHVLSEHTRIASPIHVRGAGLVGARFEVHPDPETGFNLLTPRPTGTPPPVASRPARALRLAPNQDLIEALEHATRQAGFPIATLQGGVGSTNQVRLQEPAPDLAFATELLVRKGIVRGSRGLVSILDIAVVDLYATIAQGHLIPGDNPVLMTFEGVLETL